MKTLKERIQEYQKETRYGENPDIDPLIRPLCGLLNRIGCYTVGSCSGHVRWMVKMKPKKKVSRYDYAHGAVQFHAEEKALQTFLNALRKLENEKNYQFHITIQGHREGTPKTPMDELYKKYGLNDYYNVKFVPPTNPKNFTDAYLHHYHKTLYQALNKEIEKPSNCIEKFVFQPREYTETGPNYIKCEYKTKK